jgi:hypothetical protein
MDFKTLVKTVGSSLIALNDAEVAAEFLFDIVESTIDFPEEKDSNDSANQYVISLMEFIGAYDADYADRVSIEYLLKIQKKYGY